MLAEDQTLVSHFTEESIQIIPALCRHSYFSTLGCLPFSIGAIGVASVVTKDG